MVGSCWLHFRLKLCRTGGGGGGGGGGGFLLASLKIKDGGFLLVSQ